MPPTNRIPATNNEPQIQLQKRGPPTLLPPLRGYTTISIPASYGRLASSPSPGTVVGIILGSVLGFIFLLYLVWLGISSGRKFSSETHTVASSRRRRRRGGDRIVVEESLSGTSRGRSDVIEVIEENSSLDHPGRKNGYGNGRGGPSRGWRRGESEISVD